MNVEEDLTNRFKDAIRKSLPQCPLIGPKWFCYDADSDPPQFRFLCMNKLVKATGMSAKVLASRLVKNLDLHGLAAEVRVTDDYEIQIRLRKDAAAGD